VIIGGLSLDPRRIIAASLETERGNHILTVNYLIGESVVSLDTSIDDPESAVCALYKLDENSYMGPLADAIASERLDDSDNDGKNAKSKIGFKA
jgi:hypothetical protein